MDFAAVLLVLVFVMSVVALRFGALGWALLAVLIHALSAYA